MRVLSVLATALSASGIAFATTGAVSYDEAYDNAKLSTRSIACSDGSNGLATKGYKAIGALPSFPNVGGIPAIAGWNSPKCGTCWRLTYGTRNITFTAIDKAQTINVSRAALDKLTGNQAAMLGHVQAVYQQVSSKYCGI
ncbi:immunomodulatory protein [Auricularia subglabra TFB-10046 SS5]|nr:immunomodulatory protein [Auricularia subglabra TFB-10046 SS5]